jgi:hypothetical protein
MSGDIRDEYLDVSTNIRHFQTIRFAQLTVLITISGALITILHVSRVELGAMVRTGIEAVGLLFAVFFLVLQERTMLYWRHFVRRASELETALGFKQYSTRPKAGFASSSNAMRGIYAMLIVFWIVSLIWIP